MPSILQKKSYGSVKIFWLDKKAALSSLKKIAEKIKKENVNVKAIYLFGSLAKGKATPRSDADLLILLKDSQERFLDRSAEFIDYFAEFPLAVDLFCYTIEEAKSSAFVSKILSKAIKLA